MGIVKGYVQREILNKSGIKEKRILNPHQHSRKTGFKNRTEIVIGDRIFIM
jgi:DNA-binding CsgD family transcriptional regulator